MKHSASPHPLAGVDNGEGLTNEDADGVLAAGQIKGLVVDLADQGGGSHVWRLVVEPLGSRFPNHSASVAALQPLSHPMGCKRGVYAL